MVKERNYINAIVEFYDDGIQTEVIFKVGEIDHEDDMHVFAYLKSEDEIEELVTRGNSEFKVLEYWRGVRKDVKPLKPYNPKEWDEFFSVVVIVKT
ncbi:hypothetical protein [Flagellimonas onchidii]|uniref:hypothetical protein n=1 Tax=Flagellimonas onchidii TaxID=2562684 RepID=UPI0010A67703|nr:hypothetical protein [Allomuricauda onchidii]